jgi:uncharacterized membrane protein
MCAYLKAYIPSLIIIVLVDFSWFGFLMSGFYKQEIGHLMAVTPLLWPGVLFYLLFVAGIMVFAVRPALAAHRWQKALWHGALLGLLAYGTYDLTNNATLTNWPLLMTVVDMSWGVVITAFGSVVTYFLVKFFSKKV